MFQDGRRVAPVGFAGATADLNLFPVQLIDHVDILKDGASAIYGSDAVAGVFNIWLIHRYRGLEVGAQYGNTNMGFPTIRLKNLVGIGRHWRRQDGFGCVR